MNAPYVRVLHPDRGFEAVTDFGKLGFLKIDFENPRTWKSGWKSPFYLNLREILFHPEIRESLKTSLHFGLMEMLRNRPGTKRLPAICGVGTGAIAMGGMLADNAEVPYVYTRTKKKHGLHSNKKDASDDTEQIVIEGGDVAGMDVVIVEDVVSTGGSTFEAIDAVTKAGGRVVGVLANYTWGFDVATKEFEQREIPLWVVASFEELKVYMKHEDLLTPEKEADVDLWRSDPGAWRVEK